MSSSLVLGTKTEGYPSVFLFYTPASCAKALKATEQISIREFKEFRGLKENVIH